MNVGATTEDMISKLVCEGHSVQKALNDLGLDSQVNPALGQQHAPAKNCSTEIEGDEAGDTEGDTDEDNTTDDCVDEENSASESSFEGDSEESLKDLGTEQLLGPERQTVTTEVVSKAPAEDPQMVNVADRDADGSAGANPKAPRQFIPRDHVLQLVGYYQKHFAAYKEQIKPKLPSQLVPAKVWKEVFGDYKRNHPNTLFKEESLKEPLRVALRELSKPKDQGALPDEGMDPSEDEELLTRLMQTDSFRAKGLLQERLNVADRVAGAGQKKKRKAPGQDASPGTPPAARPASSNVSAQTSGGKSVGKVTKSQNLKDAKDGISSMLTVMTGMSEERKLENQRKVPLNEGKMALQDAKRKESEERATTLVAQRTAIGETAKLSRINLLKEQKNLGIITDEQFLEACKVVFYS